MALSVPTTQAVSDAIVAQLETAIAQSIPLLPKAFCRVLAKVLAGVVVILYKYGGFIFLQMFISSASMDETTINGKVVRPLVEWGRLIGVGDPLPATRAEVVIILQATAAGPPIKPGAQFLFADTQFIYQAVTQTNVLGAGPVIFLVRATYDPNDGGGAGTAGNLAQGATLQVVNGPAYVSTTATVFGTTSPAADAETPDAYRARIKAKFQARPQGGAYADYRAWATSVPGIINAYPYTGTDPGTVEIYCEADPVSSGSPDGIPTDPQLAAVLAAINLDDAGVATRRPANAAPLVRAISRTAVTLVVSGLSGVTDVSGIQSEITEGVDEYLRSREPFIVGLSVLPRDDRITIAALGGIVDEIVNAAGGTVTSVAFAISGTPQTAITLGKGQKAKLDPAGISFI